VQTIRSRGKRSRWSQSSLQFENCARRGRENPRFCTFVRRPVEIEMVRLTVLAARKLNHDASQFLAPLFRRTQIREHGCGGKDISTILRWKISTIQTVSYLSLLFHHKLINLNKKRRSLKDQIHPFTSSTTSDKFIYYHIRYDE
jgi:hypothetical protein